MQNNKTQEDGTIVQAQAQKVDATRILVMEDDVNIGKSLAAVLTDAHYSVQVANDMGGLPNMFTGYQLVADEKARAKFSKAWGCSLNENSGLTITDMIPAILEGKLKGLYVIGKNPKLSDPDWNHLNHAPKELEFLVVQELFLSETAQVADVVFSASTLAEKEGTFTNTERRCMKFEQAIEPLGDTLPDVDILARLGTAMGYPMHYENAQEIFDELTALTRVTLE